MDDTVLKIALAAFMHDVGKFVDKAALEIDDEYARHNQDLYQPVYHGRYSHVHALCTARFIEKYGGLLPPQLNDPDWGLGGSFVNLAACHHKPETVLQGIVTAADRLSSGWDRKAYEALEPPQGSWKEYRKSRLHTVFERLTVAERDSRSGRIAPHAHCYPLAPLGPFGIFPKTVEEARPKTNQDADREYAALFATFISGLGSLLHRSDHMELWFAHFDSLLLHCTHAIPSDRSGATVPDVSLYDHARTSSALAAALYVYHRDTDSLNDAAVHDEDTPKFLLVSGDLYGIQDFIFTCHGDVRKHRSKLLRGRSLLVSLFSELAADLLCEHIGLPFSSVALNAAGKFTLIAPNTPQARQAVRDAEQEMNDWLIRMTYGETSLGIAVGEARPRDLVKGRFPEVWERLQEGLRAKKFNRFDPARHLGPVTGYLDGFDASLHRDLCPLCGKRPSSREAEDSQYVGEGDSACALCRDHVFLGTNPVKKSRLAILDASKSERGLDRGRRLLAPIYGRYQAIFCRDDRELEEEARNGRLLRCWDISPGAVGEDPPRIARKFIAGYAPVFEPGDEFDSRVAEALEREGDAFSIGDVKPFSVLAAKALHIAENGRHVGTAALGILKADVDGLGLLMSCGMPGEEFTVSRQASLSRQLNAFFTVYVPHS